MWRIRAAGGLPEVAIDLSAESLLMRWPQILPGGKFVMYTAATGTGADRATIEVQSIRGGNRKVLVRGATFGRYLTSGHLAYINQGTLYAVPFDPATFLVQGAPVSVTGSLGGVARACRNDCAGIRDAFTTTSRRQPARS